MIIMESNGNCKIEHSESTTRKQRTEGSVFLLQPFGNSQQYNSRQETKHGTEGFINPVFINGILYKEAYTNYKYKDTRLLSYAEQLSAMQKEAPAPLQETGEKRCV